MKTVVFWQNGPSIHMAPLIRELAAIRGLSVYVVTESELSLHRSAMGWMPVDYGAAQHLSSPTESLRLSLENDLGPTSYHVFQSLGVYRSTRESMYRVGRMLPPRMAVVSEPWNPFGGKAHVRRLRFKALQRRLPGRVDTHFLMGSLAREQWIRLGVPASQVFPFVYCAEGPVHRAADRVHASAPALRNWLFVGSLIPRKRVDLLLRAWITADLPVGMQLRIVGDGASAAQLHSLAATLGSDSVEFSPSLSNSDVRELMLQSDVLVLPSDFDGWGAVVNEALLSGMFVVTSDAVGASELVLSNAETGRVFRRGDVADLSSAIEMAAHKRNSELIRDWAASTISPSVICDYFRNVLFRASDEPTPAAPWLG